MKQIKSTSVLEKLMHCMKDTLLNSGGVSGIFDSEILMSFAFEETKRAFEEQNGTLDNIERDRLIEAFKSYSQGMYYSSVILSGSAVEYRLLSLISERYGKEKAGVTLGQVIQEYMENKTKYEGLLSEKHGSLLNFFATNGIFSVFPKEENGKKPSATLALCLSCCFLFKTDKFGNQEKRWSTLLKNKQSSILAIDKKKIINRLRSSVTDEV